MVHQFMKYWPTCRCAECLKIHFSLGEKASDFRARPILGELLYIVTVIHSLLFRNLLMEVEPKEAVERSVLVCYGERRRVVKLPATPSVGFELDLLRVSAIRAFSDVLPTF